MFEIDKTSENGSKTMEKVTENCPICFCPKL
jgi:hypothetical protein